MMSNTNLVNIVFLEEVLTLCQTHLMTDSRVLGLCVFGSLSTGHADEFSDIDLGILVEEDQIEVMLSDREIIEGVAPLLACSPTTVDDNCVFALHDVDGRLIKIDYNYFSDRNIPPWLSSDARVVFDPSGKLAPLVAFPRHHTPPASISSDYFCIQLWSAVRMLRRGELLETCDILNHLRDQVVLARLSQAHGVPFQNYRHVEQLYPSQIVERIRSTFVKPEFGELKAALVELSSLFRDASCLANQGQWWTSKAACERILEHLRLCSPNVEVSL